MKKYVPILMLLALFCIVTGTAACKKNEKVHASTALVLSGANPGISSCGWILKVNDDVSTNPENSFKPINLDTQFQTDGMKVKITYIIEDKPPVKCGNASAEFAGYTQINILSVQQVN